MQSTVENVDKFGSKGSSNKMFDSKYQQAVDVATDHLLYRRFEECLTCCQTIISETKNYIEDYRSVLPSVVLNPNITVRFQ